MINAIANWFGSNRLNAEVPGRLLGKLEWCGVPFLGGASELRHIDCRGGVASDKHRHLINLVGVVRDPGLCTMLEDALCTRLFHAEELAVAQANCLKWSQSAQAGIPSVKWAADYFVCTWMGRGGKSGTPDEFRQSLPVRWNAKGGGSGVRFRSAVESLQEWCRALKQWEFVCLDWFDFIQNRWKDRPGHGLYVDPPWYHEGDGYTYTFTPEDHDLLEETLSLRVREGIVVVRYGDCPEIRRLYRRWRALEVTSRDQANEVEREVYFVKRPQAED